MKRNAREHVFRVYVTDALRTISENTAVQAAVYSKGEAGTFPASRWVDIIEPKPEETRSPEEVIRHIRSKLEGADGA